MSINFKLNINMTPKDQLNMVKIYLENSDSFLDSLSKQPTKVIITNLDRGNEQMEFPHPFDMSDFPIEWEGERITFRSV